MKKSLWLRILSFVIVAMMALSVFAACDGGDDNGNGKDKNNGNEKTTDLENSTQGEEATQEASPDSVGIEKTNFDDEFYLSVMNACNPIDLYWLEESKGDAMDEAVWARQEKIFNYIGVSIKGKKTLSHTEYAQEFKTAVQNKDGSVDSILTHVSAGVTNMVQEGYFKDFQDVEGIDLEQDFWNHEFMESLSISDNYFLGFSDANILYTYVIAFNKKMLNEINLDNYSEALLYESVKNGTWTLDKFLELGQLGFQDKGSTDKHIYGLVGIQWVPWCGFFHASGVNLVEMNEAGKYEIAIMTEANKEKTADLVDKLKNYSGSGYGQFTFQTGGDQPAARLTNNRALMELASTHGLEDFLNYDISFGVLPYPMYDTDQYDPESDSLGYRSLQWGGYFGIPTYQRNELMTGTTLELMAFYSKDVQTTFYEKLLGKQVSEAPDDARMLEIVWNSVCSDMGQTFDGEVGVLYFLPKVTWNGEGGQELVSYHASVQTAGNKKLTTFIKKVDKIAKAQDKQNGK